MTAESSAWRRSRRLQQNRKNATGEAARARARLLSPMDAEAAVNEDDVAAAASILRNVRGSGQLNEVRNIENVDDSSYILDDEATDAMMSRRSSNRIANQKNQAATKVTEENIGDEMRAELEPILNIEWKFYSFGRCDSFFGAKKVIYCVEYPDGTKKFGLVYVEGQFVYCLGKRLRNLNAANISGLRVSYIDLTGTPLSYEAVRAMETIAKFSLFTDTTTNEDGVVESRYVGQGELFNADRALCEKILRKLLEYAKYGTYSFEIGGGVRPITHTSVSRKSHPNWIHYHFKVINTTHSCANCPWVGCMDEAYWFDWIDFVKETDSTCPCFGVADSIPGIINEANTCYLNATLQLIFSLPDFLSRVDNILDYKDEETTPLTAALINVAKLNGALGDCQAEIVDASELKEVFDVVSESTVEESMFENGAMHDPHEFVLSLFQRWGRDSPAFLNLIEEYFYLDIQVTRTCNSCGKSTCTIAQVHPLSVEIPIGDDVDNSIIQLIGNHFQDEIVQLVCECEGCDGTEATRSFEIIKW